ncbi:DUF1801 domain-containing protein [Dactylosporangium sp. AC04546]|uniref:DUF1801 domain-containing protein n=1 Tax=Dactylosporangium sp. AC04546 TaxID=2862460 RepID=UPI001EDFE510|nr:DUF1801 domain-containing protein [Dactylosporangium sp. AC04546]WVK80021.1 DUF1801 domain-containing protein [Dactylosporangium sp. AC04546]
MADDSDVAAFLATVPDAQRRADAERLCALAADVTGAPPALWSGSIIGFGSHHYRYESGREGDTPAIGFSPRKQALVLYYLPDDESLRARLGSHTTGKSCVYVKRLADVDEEVLGELIRAAFQTRNVT